MGIPAPAACPATISKACSQSNNNNFKINKLWNKGLSQPTTKTMRNLSQNNSSCNNMVRQSVKMSKCCKMSLISISTKSLNWLKLRTIRITSTWFRRIITLWRRLWGLMIRLIGGKSRMSLRFSPKTTTKIWIMSINSNSSNHWQWLSRRRRSLISSQLIQNRRLVMMMMTIWSINSIRKWTSKCNKFVKSTIWMVMVVPCQIWSINNKFQPN